MEQFQVVSLKDGRKELYVLGWPPESDVASFGLCMVIMKRSGGMLLGLPMGFIPLVDLQGGGVAGAVGPHTVLSVPAVTMEGDEQVDVGFDLEVMVVDVSEVAATHLVPFSQCEVEEPDILGFATDIGMLPDPNEAPCFHSGVGEYSRRGACCFLLRGRGPGSVGGRCYSHPKSEGKGKGRRKGQTAICSTGGGAHFGNEQNAASDVQPALRDAGGAAEVAAVGGAECRSSAAQSFADASVDATSVICKDDGIAAQDEAVGSGSPSTKGQPFGPGGISTGGRRSAASRRGRRSCASSSSTVIGPDFPGGSFPARGRPPVGPPGHCVFNFFRRGGRSRKAAEGACSADRGVLPSGHAECFSQDEASQSVASQPCRSCGNRLFHDTILGALRRLRKCKRVGGHSVCAGFCSRCSHEGRHGRRPRASFPGDGCHRASSSGPEQMGFGFPVDVAGRPTSADLLLQELCGSHNGPSQGFRSTVSATVGHSCAGFCKGDGLHPIPQTGDGKDPFSVSSTREALSARCAEPKEEVPKGQVLQQPKDRPATGAGLVSRACKHREPFLADQPSVSPLLSPAPLPSTSLSVRAFGTVARGRGVQAAPAGPEAGPSYSGVFGLEEVAGRCGAEDGSSMQHCTLAAWPDLVLRNVLKSKTPFAWFVHRAILHCRDGSLCSSTTALFPIPLPRDDVWNVVPKHRSKACRIRRAYRKMLHLVILALNYLHFASPLNVVHLLGRSPSDLHLAVFSRLMALIKAGGPVEKISIFNCGRKSYQLDARFNELVEAVQSLGLDSVAQYGGDRCKVSVPTKNEKDELRPYRELCADRLKLSGSGQWDPVPFLSDLFYMPYIEPRVNQFDIKPPRDVLPDLSRVDKNEVLKLCKVWDVRGLLRIFPEHCGPKHRWGLVKVFNNYKSPVADRQIGDRRGMNFCEGRISGPSKTLPTATSLLQICPRRFKEMLSGAVTDRRDFYHQFRVSDEKACGNALFPVFAADEISGFHAFRAMSEREAVQGRIRDRAVVGDRLESSIGSQYGSCHGSKFMIAPRVALGPSPKPLLVNSDRYVACFGALYQGDHLGVEFATDAHVNLMRSWGLLGDERRLQGGHAILHDDLCSGLIIDDMFFISQEAARNTSCISESAAVQQLRVAKEAYAAEELIGSDDKDVLGNVVFKVCGAEVDSSWQSVRNGVVAAGAPREKRLVLGALSSAAASLRFTSDALHSCLLGSWVSALLMRRQAMAAINELFRVIPSAELDPVRPHLHRLPRAAADELVLLSCLAPVLCSNLATPFSQKVFATDASMAKGGIVEAEVDEQLAALIWRTADRSGQNVPMQRSSQALLALYDPDFEHEPDCPVRSCLAMTARPLCIVLLAYGFNFLKFAVVQAWLPRS